MCMDKQIGVTRRLGSEEDEEVNKRSHVIVVLDVLLIYVNCLLTTVSRFIADMHGERGRTLLLASCFVLAAITGLSEGGWERVCSLDDTTSSQGVCGKQLAQMLSLVCGLRGYQGVEKRTELCEWHSYCLIY